MDGYSQNFYFLENVSSLGEKKNGKRKAGNTWTGLERRPKKEKEKEEDILKRMKNTGRTKIFGKGKVFGLRRRKKEKKNVWRRETFGKQGRRKSRKE